MRFEERELQPYAESVSASAVVEGSIYFSLNYVDDELLFPVREPVIFIGRNVEANDVGRVYFQDLRSYREGARYPWGASGGSAAHPQGGSDAKFYSGSENEVGHIFEYERALEQLMRCSLRRRKVPGRSEPEPQP